MSFNSRKEAATDITVKSALEIIKAIDAGIERLPEEHQRAVTHAFEAAYRGPDNSGPASAREVLEKFPKTVLQLEIALNNAVATLPEEMRNRANEAAREGLATARKVIRTGL